MVGSAIIKAHSNLSVTQGGEKAQEGVLHPKKWVGVRTSAAPENVCTSLFWWWRRSDHVEVLGVIFSVHRREWGNRFNRRGFAEESGETCPIGGVVDITSGLVDRGNFVLQVLVFVVDLIDAEHRCARIERLVVVERGASWRVPDDFPNDRAVVDGQFDDVAVQMAQLGMKFFNFSPAMVSAGCHERPPMTNVPVKKRHTLWEPVGYDSLPNGN